MNDDRFKNWKKPRLDDEGWAYPDVTSMQMKQNAYGWRCQHPEGLEIGHRVDIGCFTYMNAKYGIEIAENVQIGSHCAIYSDDTERGVYGRVTIGKNALIGSHTVILPGATIKPGAKIPIGSVIKGRNVFEREPTK